VHKVGHVRVLTWNLYHGRSVPPSGRSLLNEFSAALEVWEWDVALLQEVPPWWPPPLARATGAEQRTQLTSRNWLLPLRRWISERNPDILKSNGGGSNAILVRGREVLEHRAERLRRWPEARWVHGVRLADGWAVNVHSHNRPEALALADTRAAAEHALRWAAGAPLIFGGDINVRRPPELPGLVHLGGNHVDHLYSSGRPSAGPREVLDRGQLSDHPPVAVTLA
jgi:endonuclease/exonuclease/phosphatase family metal-dependent hydrolase